MSRSTEEIYALLGLGSGINAIPRDELRALWRKHGAAVTRYWQSRYGELPCCAEIAKRENWNGREARKT
jgi:hypothetical protein